MSIIRERVKKIDIENIPILNVIWFKPSIFFGVFGILKVSKRKPIEGKQILKGFHLDYLYMHLQIYAMTLS